MAYREEWEEAAGPFRASTAELGEAINRYRQAHDLIPLEKNRMLNFNAYDRGVYMLENGVGDGELWSSVRPFEAQDNTSDGVELYSQWQGIEQVHSYLKRWTDDENANTVLLDPSFKFFGLAANVLPVGSKGKFITAIIIMVLTRHHPTSPKRKSVYETHL